MQFLHRRCGGEGSSSEMEDSNDGRSGNETSSGSYDEKLVSMSTAFWTCFMRSYGISIDIVRVCETGDSGLQASMWLSFSIV